LARRGADVAVADIELDAAEQVAAEVAAEGVRSVAIAADVTRPEDVTALADEAWRVFGSVQLLFNNAGVIQAPRRLVETTRADFDWCFAVNVGGVMNCIREFAPRFLASGTRCWIVNTGSEHSLGVPHLYSGLYTATKHAVLGLSDVLRRELPEHVGVSVLCPGIVESTLWRASERRQERFGGAVPADPAAAATMQMGLPAEQVAQAVIAGVEAGNFYILTHPHVVEYARSRWQELEEAFAAQAPRYPGDEAYDVNEIIRRSRR
jgi:NAD(P)-dependent dehydrogenase (short-subunit alcohol dehydrogenase family)